MKENYIIVNHKGKGREVHFTLDGLIHIANESGFLDIVTRWMEGKTAYAMSIRKDTGKQLVTMMTEAKFRELGHRTDSELFKRNSAALLMAAATRLNIETHFESEIKAAKEAVKV